MEDLQNYHDPPNDILRSITKAKQSMKLFEKKTPDQVFEAMLKVTDTT